MISYHSIHNLHRRILGTHQSNTNWSNVKLISIHIPKTAGTSFFHSLKKQYGSKKVVRIDSNKNRININKIPNKKAYVFKNPTVIHGHFTIDFIQDHLSILHKPPIITWLRDPVERVISNYFYLHKRLGEELNEEKKGLNILAKMQRTLLEYAHDERNQNRMSKFLSGTNLEDFFYIGLVENYNHDIKELGEKLNWNHLEVFQHNKTGNTYKPKVDNKTKEIILSLNQKDQELYQQALKIKKLL